ncbi:MAG: efflux RND transporter periplasmic adaptor subunit [Acidobacteria bacterium]|nr:MAG: efflux RND transporter periplasmic adaptor subunit [Acidobacteriota bacterium]
MNLKIHTLTMRRLQFALLATLISSFLVLSACGPRDAGPSAAQTTAYGSSGAAKAELFSVPQDQMGHVQIVTAEQQTFPVVLRLSGSVAYNAFKTTPVITQVSGPVMQVPVYPGQIVRSGQPMLYVSSADFAQLRSSYLKANDAYKLAQGNLERDQDLFAHHAVAQADLLQAQSTRNQALADLQASVQALQVIGIRDPGRLANGPASSRVSVLAPIAGEVVERTVQPGQVIQAGATQVFTISDMSTVWVLVNVYQNDLSYIHMGDPVTVETNAFPTTFHGKISFIAPALDQDTRTLKVRIVTSNPHGMLKKDMYVTAVVQAGETKALTVPDDAVLRNDVNEPFVYVLSGTNQFSQRLVTIGRSEDGQTQILNGLKEGDKVAGNGSLFLQFARSLTQ